MSLFKSSTQRSLFKASVGATGLAVLFSSSVALAAISKGGANYAPPQKRSIGDFTTEYTEYNGVSQTDNSTNVTNINVSHRTVTVAYKTQVKPVLESHVASDSQATWQSGANRKPSVQTFV